jgi:hypothetical protein
MFTPPKPTGGGIPIPDFTPAGAPVTGDGDGAGAKGKGKGKGKGGGDPGSPGKKGGDGKGGGGKGGGGKGGGSPESMFLSKVQTTIALRNYIRFQASRGGKLKAESTLKKYFSALTTAEKYDYFKPGKGVET